MPVGFGHPSESPFCCWYEQPPYDSCGEGASRTPSGECADANGRQRAREHGGAMAESPAAERHVMGIGSQNHQPSDQASRQCTSATAEELPRGASEPFGRGQGSGSVRANMSGVEELHEL